MGDFTVYSAAHLAAEQTHKNLMKELPSLLSCISKSHFVALDFEYSGIERGIEDRKESRTKPDIAEYYRRVSEAARLYSVLQVGITCVFEDGEKGVYTSRTWNYSLSPGTNSKLGVNRTFRAQPDVISFLNDHDFDWNATFRAGVRYLSRDEATESRLRREDSTRPRFTDSMPASGDQIGEDMIEAARERVKLWVKDGQQKQPYVMIPVRDEDGRRPSLNGYQRSLLYTMLRREFPDLAGYKTDDGIQVRKQTPHGIAYEKKRDEYARGVNNILTSTNKGLGWIFEALVADSDLSGLTDNVLGANGEDIKKRRTIIDEAVLMLKLRGPPPIFVHNGFSDMLYLYQTFFHNLPPTWAEFSTQIHKLFPIIYDTRYLCTAKDPAKSRHESSLDHLYQRLSLTCPLPELLEMHGHWTQHNTGKAHEAGQDAYVTAMCAIKLSTWMAQIAINSGKSIEDSPILKGVDESEKARSKPLEMPPFEHAIWEPYVNRLRVYAAVEEQAEIKCGGDRCNGGRAHHRYPVETGKIYPPPPSPVQELVVVEKRTRGKKARVKVKAKAEVEVDKNNRFATLIDFGD